MEPSQEGKSLEGDSKQPSSSPLKQIRTFQGDVAEALGRQNESLVSIQRQEAAKRDPATEALAGEAEKRRKDFVFLLIGSLFLIIVGLAGAWYGYQEFLKKSAPPQLVVPSNRFIPATSETTLNSTALNRESFALAFVEASGGLGKNELRQVVLRTGEDSAAPLTSTTQFFILLESRAPGSLVRAFEPIFMIGVAGESPFMIIKLASFENAFAGMLQWEKDMGEDLAALFPKANVSASVFKDVIVKNKDVRVLEIEGETVLLYSFFDNDMVIVTDKIETLQILIERLTREHLSR